MKKIYLVLLIPFLGIIAILTKTSFSADELIKITT
jgi:hypothetical protein